jgi:phasin family protein
MPTTPRKTVSKSKAKPRVDRTQAGDSVRRPAVALSALPDFAGLLVTARRKDLEAILDANKKSYAGLQSVVQRQVEALKDAVSEWRLVIKLMAEGGARESLSKLDELALASFKMALNGIRELAEMTARSQADAYEVVSRRIREDVDEVTRLLEQR